MGWSWREGGGVSYSYPRFRLNWRLESVFADGWRGERYPLERCDILLISASHSSALCLNDRIVCHHALPFFAHRQRGWFSTPHFVNRIRPLSKWAGEMEVGGISHVVDSHHRPGLSTSSKVWHASGGSTWQEARADDVRARERNPAAGVGSGESAS